METLVRTPSPVENKNIIPQRVDSCRGIGRAALRDYYKNGSTTEISVATSKALRLMYKHQETGYEDVSTVDVPFVAEVCDIIARTEGTDSTAYTMLYDNMIYFVDQCEERELISSRVAEGLRMEGGDRTDGFQRSYQYAVYEDWSDEKIEKLYGGKISD